MTSRKNEIKRIVAEIEEYTSEIMQDAAFTLHGTLVNNPPKGTPIDTGYASAKWWFAVGSLPARTQDNENVAAAEAQQAQGRLDIATYTIGEGPIFVFNDTEYINRLNNGWSKQSPAMFVEAAVDSMTATINKKYNAKVRVL